LIQEITKFESLLDFKAYAIVKNTTELEKYLSEKTKDWKGRIESTPNI
jgi:hypothetical protein